MTLLRQKLTHFYRNLRLQTKFTITHSVIVIIPMIVLGIFFYTQLYDMIVADTIRKEQNTATDTAPLIEDEVADILNAHTRIAASALYQNCISSSPDMALDELLQSPAKAEFMNIADMLQTSGTITKAILYLDIPREMAPSGLDQAPVQLLDSSKHTYWYGIFQGNPSTKALFCPAFYLNSYETNNYGDMAYITKANMNYNSENYSCFLVVYFSSEQFTKLLQTDSSSDDSVAYLLNYRNNIIATSNGALSGTYHFDADEVQDTFMYSNNFITKEVAGETVYAGFYRIRNTDWYMIVAMPAKPLITKGLRIISGFIVIYLLCIIAASLIAAFLSRSITNRLSLVVDQMSRARIGPPVALPDSNSQDEIGELIDTYNYMTRTINDLITQQAKASEELRIAEFNLLQAQINPHFLYNTMDMINWLSKQGRSGEVTDAIQKLSRFYKLTLSKKQSLSIIDDEIEHVSIYVQLQNMRFHDRIDFIVDIPDTLLEYAIPKLTLQPIVENSILHGIFEKEEKQGTIIISGWMEGEDIVLLISDDGIGMDQTTLDTILKEKPTSHKKAGTNIAIYNTHCRLQLFYGADYGLSYTSTLGVGTEVQIRIPAHLPEDAPTE